ncbi:MAG: O-antigen ligase family protein [Oscillospiraceae bacterium]
MKINTGKINSRIISEEIIFYYVLAMFTVLPLYLDNKFFNAVQAKLSIFLAITIIALVLFAVFTVINKSYAQALSLFKKRETLFLLSFVGINIISAMLSYYPQTSLYGLKDRYNGVLLMIMYFIAFVLAAMYKSDDRRNLLIFFYSICAAIVYALAIINYFGIDPLHLYTNMSEQLKTIYVSTIGNINFFGTFLCVSLPLFIYEALFANERKINIYYMILSALGLAALVTANSDSAYVGMAVALICIICAKRFCVKSAMRLMCILALFSVECFAIGRAFKYITNWNQQLRSLSGVLCTVPVSLAIFIVSTAIVIMVTMYTKHHKEIYDVNIYKLMRILSLSAICIAIALLAAINLLKPAFILNSPLRDTLIFSDTWGSNRGYVWGRLIYLFKSASPMQKLFGTGPDTVTYLLNPHYTEYIVAFNGSTFDSAHNEYLQYLLSIGIVGLGAYLCFAASVLYSCFNGNNKAKSFGICVAAYLAQAFFNISMPIITPILFVICGLCIAGNETDKKAQEKPDVKKITYYALILAVFAIFAIGVGKTINSRYVDNINVNEKSSFVINQPNAVN